MAGWMAGWMDVAHGRNTGGCILIQRGVLTYRCPLRFESTACGNSKFGERERSLWDSKAPWQLKHHAEKHSSSAAPSGGRILNRHRFPHTYSILLSQLIRSRAGSLWKAVTIQYLLAAGPAVLQVRPAESDLVQTPQGFSLTQLLNSHVEGWRISKRRKEEISVGIVTAICLKTRPSSSVIACLKYRAARLQVIIRQK